MTPEAQVFDVAREVPHAASKPCRKCGGTRRYVSGDCAVCKAAKKRAEREAKRMEEGRPVVRRLPFVARTRGAYPLGLTEQQAKVIDALSRLGEVRFVACELGMKRSTVSQRLTQACRQAGMKNATLLAIEWSKCKWEAERAPRLWAGLVREGVAA